MISIDRDGEIATVTVDNPPVNALPHAQIGRAHV